VLQFEYSKNGVLVATPAIRMDLPNAGTAVTQDGVSISAGMTARAADGNISTLIIVSEGKVMRLYKDFLISQNQPGIATWKSSPEAGSEMYKLTATLVPAP
jgi:hypothetical protein